MYSKDSFERIENKSDLKKAIRMDNQIYFSLPRWERIWFYLISEHRIVIKKFMKHLRYEQYYRNRGNKLLQMYHARKKNILGNRLGFFIESAGLEPGITIWHHGCIVVNGGAIIGSGTVLHGDNCIGNNGIDNKCPRIGRNVDIGIGAKIIGDIEIADNCKIGAGAVVVNSCYEEGTVLIGVPARAKK